VATADVRPHPLFADNMVLQRGKPVPVWGTADDGERVTVKIQEQEAQTTARDGKWMVRLKELKAGGPYTLTIAGKTTCVISNVLVGEVWVCSGQSNMAMTLSRCADAERVIAASKDPMLRLITVPQKTSDTPLGGMSTEGPPLRSGQGGWKEAGPATVGSFSGVGYFFGRDLREALGVPVGLINSSVGGTPAEAWTSREGLASDPSLKDIFTRDAELLAAYPTAMARFPAELEAHKRAVAEAKKNGSPLPWAPRAPYGRNSTGRPSVLYNGMIAPLAPLAIRGFLWYQGEGNASRAYQYQLLLTTLIKSWRDTWGQGNLPFLIVQLAPFQKIETKPSESAWAELREAQLKTSQTVSNTALAVITDVGEEDDVHPRRKAPVGARLALAARALAYGERIESSGPVFTRMDVAGNKAVLHFDHAGDGLVAKDGPLKGFTIAGADRRFGIAEAEIEGDTVVVHSDQVEHPLAVRYGWANYPLGNLWNKQDLPASPFRTDVFPLTTLPHPREVQSRALAAAAPAPAAAASVEEVTYKSTPQGDLSLLIHRPEGWKATDKRPAIVFFFGGGWTNGSVRQFESQAAYLAGRGMVAARADYRVKSRQNVQPDACVEDAKSAVRWLRTHAGAHGIDPDRIVAAGGSAGGHIAACTATTAGFEAEGQDLSVSSKPSALVLFNPVLLLDGPITKRYLNDDEALARRISPMNGIDASLPPTLLLYGSDDRLGDPAEPFMARAKAKGARVELFMAEGVGHGFFNRSPWTARTLKRVDEFLGSLGYVEGPPTIEAP
jgi:sialate O-acetylesterase